MVTGGAAALADTEPAKRQVELVMDDQCALQRHPVLCPQRLGRQSREVHHRLRLGEDQLPVADADPAGERLGGAVGDPRPMAPGQLVDHQEAQVVPRTLIVPAGIAQADHEPAIASRRGSFPTEHRPVA